MKKIEQIIKFLKQPVIPISANDSSLIKQLKTEFEHNKRSFMFNKFKYYVDCLYCHAIPGTIEKVLEYLNSQNKENKKLLNLGGGTGQVSNMIKKIGYEVYNLDIEIINENEYNKQYDLNSTTELPYDEGQFDYVLCQEVIEHIENPWKLFRDINKVLKKDGILILTTPNIQSNYSKKIFNKSIYGNFHWFKEKDFGYHVNPLPYWEVELIAGKSGFSLNTLEGNGTYYFNKRLSKKDMIRYNENLIFIYEKK